MRIALKECLLVALTVGTLNAFTSLPSALCIRTPTCLNAEGEGDMSQALLFLPQPKHLDGSLAGDVGFDPFGFGSKDEATLVYMREAEIKHSQLAMLAAVG
mmetsp:Transcript_15368/g.19209  ORF Transcript_15368/g.19209 Transcript_15368/m.19209 type:complete len:101 (-) Transcript_15368:249-551(-)